MKDQATPLSPLGVAGKFQIAQSQIGKPSDFYRHVNYAFQRRSMAFHNEGIGFRDARQRPRVPNFQDQRIVETSRSLHDRPAPAAPAENGDILLLTSFQIYFQSDFVGIPDDHEVLFRFPKP